MPDSLTKRRETAQPASQGGPCLASGGFAGSPVQPEPARQPPEGRYLSPGSLAAGGSHLLGCSQQLLPTPAPPLRPPSLVYSSALGRLATRIQEERERAGWPGTLSWPSILCQSTATRPGLGETCSLRGRIQVCCSLLCQFYFSHHDHSLPPSGILSPSDFLQLSSSCFTRKKHSLWRLGNQAEFGWRPGCLPQAVSEGPPGSPWPHP